MRPDNAAGRARCETFRRLSQQLHVSLIEALGKRFPGPRQLVGDDFFRGMAPEFVQAVKPGSPVLLEYGGEFPAFVASFAPADTVPYLADRHTDRGRGLGGLSHRESAGARHRGDGRARSRT
ncbi:HvfC/BufC family peptide modification chaperone [Aurantimonas marina]|uniref:HvfC/BufC family peptide modification chaperone n=1 Tax=Aurantimonas marina TaxID=2780508 RepID=UPI001E403828|nr:DNA-binding domain-containing protein [Aurantimonas marina]